MKNLSYWAFLCLVSLLVVSCSDEPEIDQIDPPDETLYPVNFSIQLNEEILPFSRAGEGTMANTAKLTTRSETRAEKDVNELCNMIDYFVYKDGNTTTPYKYKRFTLEESGVEFGIIVDSLPRGDYQVVFLAYDADLVSPPYYLEYDRSVSFWNRIEDTFHVLYPLTIYGAGQIESSITLYRVISKIEFVSTDAVPKDANVIYIFSEEDYCSSIDILTGRGIKDQDSMKHQILYYFFTEEDRGEAGFALFFMTFVPEDVMTIELAVMDQNFNVFSARNQKNIQAIANRTIRYTGHLFDPTPSDDTFTLSIHDGGEWGGVIEKELD